MVKLSKQEWEKFCSLYGEEMYRDKLAVRSRPSDEDAKYVEVIFGHGCNYSGYDLVEEFKQQSAKQGELDV
tara:strand:- start:412 stop:624 length:213 start_codon:yes stop_codon:yes gene_type:complete